MYLYMITLVVESCRDELVRKYMYNNSKFLLLLKVPKKILEWSRIAGGFFPENMT